MTSHPDDPLRPLAEVLQPDERQEFLVESLEHLHARLSTLVLHEHVPVDVRQMFETAKNERLYTYFVYRFHQVAELPAYQVFERALKHRWNSEIAHLSTVDDEEYRWPGLARLITHAKSAGWIRNEGFSGSKRRAWLSLVQEQGIAAIRTMIETGSTDHEAMEPTPEEVEERAAQVDVVSILESTLPSLRNQLAHGAARLSPTSDFVLQDMCDAINMVFDGTPTVAGTRAASPQKPSIHGLFETRTSMLESKRLELFSMKPMTRESLPRHMPLRGVYLFSEAGRHLYVGRSNSLRKRICRHCRAGARHNMASFAFRLAIEECGAPQATYRKGQGRAALVQREDVAAAFKAAKNRIRKMQLRFVEEVDPIQQMLLEAYVAVVHGTPQNDFDNH